MHGSLGACNFLYYHILNNKRNLNDFDKMQGSFLGAKYNDKEILRELNYFNLNFNKILNKDELYSFIAKKISEGNSVGWFSGKAEYGPRALGARSIIADPRPHDMQKI